LAEETLLNTIGARLKKVQADLNLKVEDMAIKIGMDRGQLGKVLNDKLGVTTKQVLEISSQFGVRTGWILEGELPVYVQKKSGNQELPDHYLPTLSKHVSQAFSNLQEAMKMLPQPMGPEITAVGDAAFRKGKKNKQEKQ
jgi:transcriptional regulator with XRE-family HTH domain